MDINTIVEKIDNGWIEIYKEVILIPMVKDIRKRLNETYNTSEGENEDYTGLCDTAVDMFIEEINEKMKSDFSGIEFKAWGMHGEQRHVPLIPSAYWCCQHTWAAIQVGTKRIYIDPTCGQFNWLWGDSIPDFYVSEKPPRWFYDDRKNPTWNGITRKINEWIKVPVYLKDQNRWVKDGLVEFIQYNIWGRISDIIYEMRVDKKNV